MTPRLAVLGMLCAVIIYGANFALTRHATLNGLTPHDLAALRFGTSGLLLLPLFLRAGARSCAGVGWGRGLILALTSGAPMVLLMNSGLALAPAAHGAAIQPGAVTVVGALGSILLFGVAPTRILLVGIATVLAGLACMGIAGTTSLSPTVPLGDALFLCAGLLWGFYALCLQRWGVGAMAATTVVAVLSLGYLPVYAVFLAPGLLRADPGLVLFHALNQGVLNTIIALWLWGNAVTVLGAPVTQRFPPLIPVTGTLLAIPLLGEWPGPFQGLGAALIVAGLIAMAVGDRLWRRLRGAPATLKAGLTTRA